MEPLTRRQGAAPPAVTHLWPDGAARLTRRPGLRDSLLVLPSARRPRLLVPAGVGGAHVMFARHTRGGVHRAGQETLAWLQRAGLLRFLPLWRVAPGPGPAITDVVRAHVPAAAAVGVLLGPPRANAKPVLQVFGGSGDTIAFGKVGSPGLTAGLVRHEAAVLADLARRRLTHFEVPRLLHAGPWRDHEVLLMTALPAAQRRSSSWEPPWAAMTELAELDGRGAPARVQGSDYAADLGARVAALGEPGPARWWAEVLAVAGDVEIGFGRWHGDWAPWNMGRASGVVQVWDWERCVAPVPLGFDAVHFVLQHQFSLGASAAPALAAVTTQARLERWYDDPVPARATVLLYLVDILHRYAGDGAQRRSAALARRIAVIEQMIAVAIEETRRPRRADA